MPIDTSVEAVESNLPEDSDAHEREEARKRVFTSDLLSAVKAREAEFTKGWWMEAKSAYEIYSMEKDSSEKDTPYNILYSNTEVLLPSLYSATPKPDIRTRFRGENLKPIPEVCQRFLTIAADPGNPGEDCFDGAMADAVLSALIPGMGYVRIRYVENRSFPLVYESGAYQTLIWGKATRWSKVPWLAFKHPMKREQMLSQFGITPEEAAVEYKPSSDSDEDSDDCCVYEVWDKATKTVYFLCEEWNKTLLKESPDPLGLVGFYPTPGLLCLTAKPGKLAPIPLFRFYKNQADELNRVSARLNKVLSAIRVRGAYNSLMGDDLKKILSDDSAENELVAASESAMLAQSGGFDKHIWLLPIEKLIIVAQELYKAREAIKQVIYELTGISDIIRGSSVASETATAQDLKAKWGTVRLRRMQTIVGNYARDLFRMSIDCGADHISPEKWAEITQIELPTEEQKAIAKQQLAYNQQMASMQPQVPGQPPQAPPQPDPKILSTLQTPSWESVLGKLKTDANRTFVVNIQTSSTIDLDTAQDKSEVSEYMNAMAQLASGLQPLMALGPTGLEAVKALLIGVSSRFKFSQDLGEVFSKIQSPPPPPPEPKGPPPPSPEELAVVKAEAQAKLAKIAADQQVLAANTAYQLAKIEADKQMLALKVQAAQLQLAAKRATIPPSAPTTKKAE